MKKIIFQIISIAALLTPAALKSQSNITIDAGAAINVQTGADICADTRTINGLLTGAGTWCLIPLTPTPPLPVSPSNNAVGQNISLTFLWQRSLGAVTYRFQLSTDSLFGTLIVNDSTVADSTRTVTGLLPRTYYWWRINAKGLGGTSVFSVSYKFRTLGYPNQISLVSPANNSINMPTSITFVWSRASEQTQPFTQPSIQISKEPPTKTLASKNVSVKQIYGIDAISNYWYDLVTDTVSLANLLKDSTLTDTTKFVSGLSNSTNYYWRVRAKNQIGWGSYSVWYKFTTIVSAPPPPLLVSPANNAVGQNLTLTLVWNKSAGATNYRVQVATDSLFTGLIVNDSTLIDSTRIISGLTPLTYYWWKVNAKNIGGTSGYSSVFKFRTIGNPFTVILISPANNAINQPISLTCVWRRASEHTSPFTLTKPNGKQKDEVDAISNYWFDMVTDTVTLANRVTDSTLTDTTKTLNGLNYLTSYYWRVRAKNQIGYGNYSVWFKFTTIPLPPALLTLNVIPGGFYNGSVNQLNMKDTVRIVLVDSALCTRVDSAKVTIDSVTFSATPIPSFSVASTGKYYIYIYHRNHLAISSRFTQTVTRGSTVSYDFTTDSAKTYGFNVIKVNNSPVRWGMIPGDANQDGYVDGLDQTIWIAQNGNNGYFSADFNGDTYVDGLDQTLWIIYNGNSTSLPCYFEPQNPGDHFVKKNIQGNNDWNHVSKNIQQNQDKSKDLKK
jgi:hypothetical protein